MPVMNFTVEETNIIAIYKESTVEATISRMKDARHYMISEMWETSARVIEKLSMITNDAFALMSFTLTDET